MESDDWWLRQSTKVPAAFAPTLSEEEEEEEAAASEDVSDVASSKGSTLIWPAADF